MIGDGPWVMHNLYQYAIRTPNTTALTELVYPLLRAQTQMYLNITFLADGAYHLPPTNSPEYPKQLVGNDTNYDIALFAWSLRTLIGLAHAFFPTEPRLGVWEDVATRLTPGPIDTGGYMVNNATSFSVSHRHFSHAFHVYPLRLLDFADPTAHALAERTVLLHCGMLGCWTLLEVHVAQ